MADYEEEYVKINSEKLPPETMNQFSSFLEEFGITFKDKTIPLSFSIK